VPSFADRAVGILRQLFPEPAESAPRPMPRSLSVVLQVTAVFIGALVMLVRVPGKYPAWDGLYAEDFSVFLVQALQHPWHLLIPDGGYIELVPRLIAQLASYLPLRDAAAAFAISGALVTAGCGLFIFHASAGHVRSPVLRFVLALAVVLLPVALLEIADSGVGTPWYLLFALFWAVLWRPRTRAGMVGAAAVGFFTAASTTMSIVFAPLLLARLIAFPRSREHAVTAGWTAGCLLQVPDIVSNLTSAHSRAGDPASLRHVLAFYAHDVVLPALGWHLGWRLQSFAGRDGATLIVGGILAVVFLAALITQRGPARVFVVASLITGFLFTAFGAGLSSWVTTSGVMETGEPGSRYTTLPIFLIGAAAIVAVDSFIRHTQHRLQIVAAVTALVMVLSVGWVTDFRYLGWRSSANDWPPIATAWLHACQHKPDGVILELTGGTVRTAIPCASLRRLCPLPDWRCRYGKGRCVPRLWVGTAGRAVAALRDHRWTVIRPRWMSQSTSTACPMCRVNTAALSGGQASHQA
jgi:hypothetical protein